MTISFAFAAAAAVAFAAIAWSDLRSWRIPNGHVLLVLVLGLLRLAAQGDLAAAAITVAAAAAVFAGFLPIFAAGWMGGGDVKLLAAATVLVGYARLPEFLLLTAVLGAVLAGLVILQMTAERRFGFALGLIPSVPPADGASPRAAVPYGLAIAGAGLLVVLQLG